MGLSGVKKIQAIILDLDGTLLDTLEDLADSMNGALSHFGFPVHALDKYKYFVGTVWRTLSSARCLVRRKTTFRRSLNAWK